MNINLNNLVIIYMLYAILLLKKSNYLNFIISLFSFYFENNNLNLFI